MNFVSCYVGRVSPRYHRETMSNHENPTASMSSSRIKEQAREQLKLAMAEKAFVEDARRQARRQIEIAEQEFSNAKRIRHQARSELDRALALKEQATKQVNAAILQVTCQACKQLFQAARAPSLLTPDENSLVLSYNNVSSGGTEGEIEKDNS